jgi:hypothetical protein
MSNNKKRAKKVAHAAMVWERDQLRAATMSEQLNKALAAVEQYKDELTVAQINDVYAQVEVQRGEIKDFLLKARNKYVTKMSDYGLEPTLTKEVDA